MLEIERKSVVGGTVLGDNLVLTKFNGETITAGSVRGPTGANGPAGAAGAEGAAGPAGPAGIPGLAHRGPWDAAVNYILNDAVYYAGGTYRALKAVVGGSVPSVAVDTPQAGVSLGSIDGPAGTYSTGTKNRQPFWTGSSQTVASVGVPITSNVAPTAPVTATLRRQSDGVAIAVGTLAVADIKTVAPGAAPTAYIYNVFTFTQPVTLPAAGYWLDLDSTANFTPVIFYSGDGAGTVAPAITNSGNWSRPPEAEQFYRMPFRLLSAVSYSWDRIAVKGDVGSTGPAGVAGPTGPAGATGAAFDIGDATAKTSAQIDALFTTVPANGTLATGLMGTVPTLFMRRAGLWHSSGAYTQIA